MIPSITILLRTPINVLDGSLLDKISQKLTSYLGEGEM